MAFIGSGPAVTNLNANNIASGTVGTARLGSGTANSSTFLRGDNTWQPVASGGDYIMRTYTGPATWTKPSGLKAVKITVIGGGGGGAGCNGFPTGIASSGAGGGGGTSIRYLPAPSIPGPVAVTVGAGGAAQTSIPLIVNQTNRAGTGGTSSFGPFASATGGAGGQPNRVQTVVHYAIGGAGGTGSGGDINLNGQIGQTGQGYESEIPGPGTGFFQCATSIGGDTILSFNTNTVLLNTAGNISTAGTAGSNFGGGGGGAVARNATGVGAAGAAGVVLVEEFY
jgi:hypothetical protein